MDIWSLKCLESRFCAQHPSRCFLALLDFVSAGQLSRSSTHVDTSLRQDKQHTIGELRDGIGENEQEQRFMFFLFITLSIGMVGYHSKCFDIGANTLNELNAKRQT